MRPSRVPAPSSTPFVQGLSFGSSRLYTQLCIHVLGMKAGMQVSDLSVELIVGAVAEKEGLSHETKRGYTVALRSFAKHVGSLSEALCATDADARSWAAELEVSSVHTAHQYVAKASALFNHLMEDGIVFSNPFKEVETVRPDSGKSGYKDPVSAPEIRKIVGHAMKVGRDPTSSDLEVTAAAVVLLHVKYFIPFSSLAALSMGDYRFEDSVGVLSWWNNMSKQACIVELDKHDVECLNRCLSKRGETQEEDPLFAVEKGRNVDCRIDAKTLSQRAHLLYADAGVAIGHRSLRLGVLNMALDENSTISEVVSISSNIGMGLAYSVTKDRAQRSACEMWNKLGDNINSEIPIVQGFVSVRDVKDALDMAGDLPKIAFTVTAQGDLMFSLPEE